LNKHRFVPYFGGGNALDNAGIKFTYPLVTITLALDD